MGGISQRVGALASCTGLALVLAGCAAKQLVAVDPGCVPERVTLYVDGRALDAVPRELRLRSDRPHKLWFKGPGYVPQLIILRPESGEDGSSELEPREVCAELSPIGLERRLELSVDEDQ